LFWNELLQRRETMSTIQLTDILPPDLRLDAARDFRIERPDYAFESDHWTFAFLRGLKKLELDGLRGWEVGCGTGFNEIMLRLLFPQFFIYYSDFDARCPDLARLNLSSTVGTDNTSALEGSWDLITGPEGQRGIREEIDILLACVPQVPANGIDLGHRDNLSNYYDQARYAEFGQHHIGLGLLDALLAKARDVTRRVVLNISGRPGWERVKLMFHYRGYEARIIHEEVIPQHRPTSLSSLAILELLDQPDFEFFIDQEGTELINARTAEERRRRRQPVFHKIRVVEGTLR